jgi:hypothetical protein
LAGSRNVGPTTALAECMKLDGDNFQKNKKGSLLHFALVFFQDHAFKIIDIFPINIFHSQISQKIFE